MKSYEETIRSVHSKISMYEAEKRRKRIEIAGAAAAVLPVCLAVGIGTGLWKNSAFMPADIQVSEIPIAAPTETVSTGTVPEQSSMTASVTATMTAGTQTTTVHSTEPEVSGAVPKSGGESLNETVVQSPITQRTVPTVSGTQPQTVSITETRLYTEPCSSAEPRLHSTTVNTTAQQPDNQSGNGPMLRADDEPPAYRTLITSYPVSSSADYRAPYDGEVCYTVPLFYAMKEYGADENTDFLVIIEIYSNNGEKQLMEYADLKAEWNRLGALGYEAGLNQPSDASPFLTLKATYEELQSFPAEADRGYFLRLYQEDQPDFAWHEWNSNPGFLSDR